MQWNASAGYEKVLQDSDVYYITSIISDKYNNRII